MFTFSNLAEYEQYREKSLQDTVCIAAFKYAEETKCIISYERTFFRPVFNAEQAVQIAGFVHWEYVPRPHNLNVRKINESWM